MERAIPRCTMIIILPKWLFHLPLSNSRKVRPNGDSIVIRFDTQSNETSTWMQIPQNQNVFGAWLLWGTWFLKNRWANQEPHWRYYTIYVNTISQKNFETDEGLNNVKVGGDAKVSIGNSMNLGYYHKSRFFTGRGRRPSYKFDAIRGFAS